MSIASVTTAGFMQTMDLKGSGGLTADALYVYLQTRLSGIDEQIDAIMDKQMATEAARKALQKSQNLTARFQDGKNAKVTVRALQSAIDAQPTMQGKQAVAKGWGVELNDEGKIIVDGNDDISTPEGETEPKLSLSAEEAGEVKQTFDNELKDLGAQGELEMIKLQSLMSARNSAISLATNLLSAIGKGYESVVGNVGR